jgi:hypothetical protein
MTPTMAKSLPQKPKLPSSSFPRPQGCPPILELRQRVEAVTPLAATTIITTTTTTTTMTTATATTSVRVPSRASLRVVSALSPPYALPFGSGSTHCGKGGNRTRRLLSNPHMGQRSGQRQYQRCNNNSSNSKPGNTRATTPPHPHHRNIRTSQSLALARPRCLDIIIITRITLPHPCHRNTRTTTHPHLQHLHHF